MTIHDTIVGIENEIASIFSNAKASAIVKEVEEDAEAIGSATLNYIKDNGLQALYKMALGLLAGIASGTPWATVGAALVAQGEAAGITIAKGAEAIVLAQAQADLIAIGQITSPTTNTAVANPAAVTAPTA